MLGILGGMGPLATADFMQKIVRQTHASRDQANIPILVWSVPQIPDRTQAILGGGESPLPEMIRGVNALKAMGARCIAIPCNTAHFWYDELQRQSGLPIIHIAQATSDEIVRHCAEAQSIGILATAGTLAAKIYQPFLQARYRVVEPQGEDVSILTRGIALVKAGQLDSARPLFEEVAGHLRERHADVLLLACTEIPLAAPRGGDVIDTVDALARKCVAWYQAWSPKLT